MKLMITWLETILSRWGAVADAPRNSEDDESDSDVASSTQGQGPEENATMPDIYADELAETVPHLRHLEPSSPDADKTTGFNPYDTAKMHKK